MMKGLTLFLLCIGLVVYNLIAGAVFYALESKEELNIQTWALEEYTDFLCKLSSYIAYCIVCSYNVIVICCNGF